MNTVKFNGKPTKLSGNIPNKGEKAEDFTFVKEDLSEGRLDDYAGKVKVIMALPSLDTGVCQKEARAFNEKLAELEEVVGIIVSKDLPMAMKRFCSAEGIENVISASDFRYNDFSSLYNVDMTEGPLKGLMARVVWVLDRENNISYVELVDDITHEPDYSQAVEAVKTLL